MHKIPLFEKARVTIVGDVMIDRYWHGDALRISPEAPVPVVHIRQTENRLGGAANVAFNVKALGSAVCLFGLVGDDEFAINLENKLTAAKVNHSLFHIPNFPTISKLRVIGRNQQLIRLDTEEHFNGVNCDQLIATYNAQLANTDLVILSDYNKGTLSQSNKLI